MRIATLATGGIGGFLAVHLAEAGHEVCCVARGAHLEAIRAHGVRLISPDGQRSMRPAVATSDPAEIGPVDAVVFGIKGNGLPDAARAGLPLIGRDTVVVPFLNGVEASERLCEILPPESVANGVAYVSTTITAPGVITQTGTFARFVLAERDSRPSPRITALQRAIRATGFDAPEVDDIDREIWNKLILFSAVSGVTTAARCTVDEIRDTPELIRLTKATIAETAALARARGITVSDDAEARTWTTFQSLPQSMRASTAIDLEAGQPLETHWINGAVVRLAEAAGLDVPVNQALLAVLSPHIAGRK